MHNSKLSRRIIRILTIGLAICSVGLAIACWLVGTALIAPANCSLGTPPDDMPIESLIIESNSGSQLATWYIPGTSDTATVLLLHPVRSDRRSMLARARLFYEAGFAVVMIDFQAHGESPGGNITFGFREKHDVRAAIQFARERNPSHRLGIVGRSLGGAASLLAGPLDIDAMVLESVYPTLAEAVHDRVEMRLGMLSPVLTPMLLAQLPLRMDFSAADLRPIDFINALGCPVLIATGDRDAHTPLDEARRMFTAAAEPKTFVVFEGAGHVDLLRFDADWYRSEVVEFMNSCLD